MKRYIIALLLLLVTPALAGVDTVKVNAFAQAEFDKQKLVGLAVEVIDGGKVAWMKAYGYADREKQIPVDLTATQFRWASTCKPLTAVAAMQLVDKGLLDLDADIRTYVPEFPDKGVKITVRQLLCHEGGIVHYSNGLVVPTQRDYTDPHPFSDVITALDTFKDSPLANPPGEKFSYSTHGYMLLSAVIQRAGKQKFADQLHERIAVPLGMNGFQPDYQWVNIPNRAAGYSRMGDAIVPRADDADVSWKSGGGGYVSPTNDLAAFACALLNHKLVSQKSEELMWTPNVPKQMTKDVPYGFGFFILDRPSHTRLVGHDGSQSKGRSALLIEPTTGRGVVIMSNSEWFDPMPLAIKVMDMENVAGN